MFSTLETARSGPRRLAGRQTVRDMRYERLGLRPAMAILRRSWPRNRTVSASLSDPPDRFLSARARRLLDAA